MTAKRSTVSLLTTPDPAETPAGKRDSRIFIAPELRGHEHDHMVVRHEGDSDEDYARRCELFALVIESAPKS
jgi:hypothetical protein